jgi:hypothetical protein
VAEGQVYIGLSRGASVWYSGLSEAHRKVVDPRLRELARDPERAPVRATSPGGRLVYVALAVVEDWSVWAYRIDFVVDEIMRDRAKLPAIAVLRATPLRR